MGIILVFDLDQTIVDTKIILRTNNNNNAIFFPQTPEVLERLKQEIEAALNPTILNILKQASLQRYSLVDAILLLTNNSSERYVAAVDSVLSSLCGNYGKYQTNNINSENENAREMPKQRYFFDEIMMRNHRTRLNGVNKRTAKIYGFESDLTKRLKDVQKMMEYLDVEYKGYSSKYYKENTYFFDDNPHVIDSEIDNSIRITPPFRVGRVDRTDYSPILNRLFPNYTGTRVRPLTMFPRKPSSRPALLVTRRGGRRIKKMKKTRNRFRK